VLWFFCALGLAAGIRAISEYGGMDGVYLLVGVLLATWLLMPRRAR
jgi:hypothetical protein